MWLIKDSDHNVFSMSPLDIWVLAPGVRRLCSRSHRSGYSCLGTEEGCIWATPPYPWQSEWPPQWAHWLECTVAILMPQPWLSRRSVIGWSSLIGTSLVTGLFRTLHPGQHGKVALIGGVGTTMGISIGCLGAACSHWGQRGYYLGGKVRVYWEFLNNIPSICLLGKLRIVWKFISDFALKKPSG